jgi:homoprotocatechuate degradation regulator HpaR
MSLLRAREAMMRHFRTTLGEFNITEQQWRVLRALTSLDEVEISQLAQITFLLPSSLSRILRDLEQRSLIARRQAPEDRRCTLVSIAPDGTALIERAAPEMEQIYGRITRALGADNLAALQRLLRELEQAAAPLT